MLEPSELPQQLAAFIGKRWDAEGQVTIEDFAEITGGYSRYMARFTASSPSRSQGFILRADPRPGQSIIDTDRSAEWRLVNAVAAAGGVSLPEAYWFDETGDELGSPAIIFEKIEGDTLHTTIQPGEVSDHSHHAEPLAELLASIHMVETALLPEEMKRPTSWDAYIDIGIAEWAQAEADHVERDPFMRLCAAWLDANRPPEAPLTLVHGDLQAPNVMIEEGSGEFHMLDWELSRIGDPREDLGWWVLAHKSQPPDLIEGHSDAFFSRYRELTGLSEEVVNPATVGYFTVLASRSVFNSVIGQTAAMSREETTAMSVAYMTNAIPFMHSMFIDGMDRAGAWGGAK